MATDGGWEGGGPRGDGGSAPKTPGRVQGTLHPRARPADAPDRHAAIGMGKVPRRHLTEDQRL